MARDRRDSDSGRSDLKDFVVKIRRCAAVVKGGRRFSFSAMVVVGNGKGKVGWGHGKANEVPPSVEKAVKDGTRNMIEVSLTRRTIPHKVECRFGAGHVVRVRAGARPVAAATRVRASWPAGRRIRRSKAARCRCRGASRSAVLTTAGGWWCGASTLVS